MVEFLSQIIEYSETLLVICRNCFILVRVFIQGLTGDTGGCLGATSRQQVITIHFLPDFRFSILPSKSEENGRILHNSASGLFKSSSNMAQPYRLIVWI